MTTMDAERAAEAVRAVEWRFDALRDQLLDQLIGWRDARVEAPPEGVRILVVYDSEVIIARYEGDNGQPYRRLPNAEGWGHWSINSGEGTRQIIWWMPLPQMPRGT